MKYFFCILQSQLQHFCKFITLVIGHQPCGGHKLMALWNKEHTSYLISFLSFQLSKKLQQMSALGHLPGKCPQIVMFPNAYRDDKGKEQDTPDQKQRREMTLRDSSLAARAEHFAIKDSILKSC